MSRPERIEYPGAYYHVMNMNIPNEANASIKSIILISLVFVSFTGILNCSQAGKVVSSKSTYETMGKALDWLGNQDIEDCDERIDIFAVDLMVRPEFTRHFS